MNTDRLLRAIGKRLEALSTTDLALVLDVVREELGRERRWSLEPEGRVEVERERRLEAEALREVLEAIHHQVGLEDTIDEILKQVQRVVSLDSCTLALAEPGGGFRVVAGHGAPEPKALVGSVFQNDLSDQVLAGQCAVLADVHQDTRYTVLPGGAEVRSCAGIPLVVEGEVIGMIRLERQRVDPFEEEDLHRVRILAFSAAAALRKARLLDQVRRYARLMERVVNVDQAVFSGQTPAEVAAAILEGALRFGGYPGGLLALREDAGLRVVAAQGEAFEKALGQEAPDVFAVSAPLRLEPGPAVEAGRVLGIALAAESLYLVPLRFSDHLVGSLVLQDPNGETPDDALLEAYTTRAASAYVHTVSDLRR